MSGPRLAIIACLAGLLVSCAPEVERTGLGDAAPASVIEANWAIVGDDPAIEALTVRGTVVVQAAERVTAPGLARVVDLPVAQGDAVAVGDVIAVLQPTTPEIEAFDLAVLNLAAATAAAGGPAATRPSTEQVEALVAERDAAALGVRNADTVELEPVELLATSVGVVVSVGVPLGTLVDADDVVATVGPVSSVEVHVRVDDAVLELFTASADEAVLVERAVDTESQAVALAPADTRVVSREETDTVLRMVFVDPPRVTEGQRIDVEVQVDPAPGARSLPLDAVRIYDGSAFVLIDDDVAEGGLRRVDIVVTRLGAERAEFTGDVELGDRVLRR